MYLRLEIVQYSKVGKTERGCTMQSHTLGSYKKFLATANAQQLAFVDEVFGLCERNYENGGSVVVECFSPEEILEEFKTLADVKKFCGMKLEQATNCRWGADDDPQLEDLRKFKEEWVG